MLRKIDIFASHVGMRINQDEKYRSSFGGCMTILAIILMIMLSLGTVLKFYLDEDEYNISPSIENLTYKNDEQF